MPFRFGGHSKVHVAVNTQLGGRSVFQSAKDPEYKISQRTGPLWAWSFCLKPFVAYHNSQEAYFNYAQLWPNDFNVSFFGFFVTNKALSSKPSRLEDARVEMTH